MTDKLAFGPYRVNPDRRELTRNGRLVPLGGRAFDILLSLLEADGRLVTKDELMESVWPGVVVEENNIQVQVSTLRKALAGGIACRARHWGPRRLGPGAAGNVVLPSGHRGHKRARA